jgi:hypothetical protein
MSLLVREFLAKHKMTVIPQLPYSPDLAPADYFFVPEVEIHSERLPISDDRRDKRKFAMRPTCYLARTRSRTEKKLEAAYGQWRGIL